MPGIGDVIRWCRDHGVVPALATLAWRPVGTYLCEAFGFDDCCGPALEIRDGVFTGVALGSCDEYGKRDFAATATGDLISTMKYWLGH